MATKISRKYVKLSVPEDDTTVLEWLAVQVNMSDSIRSLIRDDVQKNGYSDLFCREVIPGAKRGRPTNAELQMRAEQEESVGSVTRNQSVVEKRAVTKPVKTEKPTKVAKPVVNQSGDDGFVDPEELLGLM